MTILLRPSFDSDLADIWLEASEYDPVAADELLDDIVEHCQMLAEHCHAGPIRTDVAEGCRHLLIGSVLVLYQVNEGYVELVRALHGNKPVAIMNQSRK